MAKKKPGPKKHNPRKTGHTECTETQVIEALIKWRGKSYLAARDLGISHVTLLKYRKRWPEVERQFQELKGMQGDVVEQKLYTLIEDGNLGAIIFYLKTQCKDRGYVESQELTGANGAPLNPSAAPAIPIQKLLDDMSIEAKRDILAALQKRREQMAAGQQQALPST